MRYKIPSELLGQYRGKMIDTPAVLDTDGFATDSREVAQDVIDSILCDTEMIALVCPDGDILIWEDDEDADNDDGARAIYRIRPHPLEVL